MVLMSLYVEMMYPTLRFSDSQMQIEATGSEKVASDAIQYVRRGGTLMLYALYTSSSLIHWPPSKIFGDEINVSFTHKSSTDHNI